MQNTKCRLLPAKPAILALLLGANLVATANPLESITVTASRTPVTLIESGSAVSIIDRETILNSNALYLVDLLRAIPGVHVSQQGARGSVTQIRMRGAEANQVMVMIDGIEANDPAQGSEFNFAHLPTAGINRVEIVRGPQSALWGSDALAGVINIITSPEQPANQVGASLEAGTHNSRTGTLAGTRTFDSGAVTAAISHYRTDGTNISRQGSEADGYKTTTLNLTGKHHFNDAWSLAATLRRTTSKNDYDSIDFNVTGLPVDADNQTTSEHDFGRVALHHHSATGKLQQYVAVASTRTDNRNDTDSSPVDDVSRADKTQVQYGLNYNFTDAHTFSTLLEHESVQYEQRGLASFFGNPNKDLEASSKSLGLEYRFDGERWNFSASSRHDNSSEFNSATTWRLTGSVQTPTAGTRLFASLGTGTKNPTFTERFGFFDSFTGNPDLKPEQSLAWELGLRTDSATGQVQTSLSYFNSELKDEINGFIFDAGTGGFTAANLAGRSHREGVEIESHWQLNSHLNLHATYTYTKASSEDSFGADISEVRRPEHTGSVAGTYQWTKGQVTLSVNHQGEQEDDFFPPFPPYQSRVTLDAFTLVNFSGSLQISDQVTLTARLDNLLDENYEEVYGFVTPGFTAAAGIRMNW